PSGLKAGPNPFTVRNFLPAAMSHRVAVPPSRPVAVARYRPPGLTATSSRWRAGRESTTFPVVTSRTAQPVGRLRSTSRRLSGRKATTEPEYPGRDRASWSRVTSQTRTVWSELADARRRPSGLKARLLTEPTPRPRLVEECVTPPLTDLTPANSRAP